ncbi:MAG: amino acid--tRNA ligase-related protein [Patescibacteria group bacterium]|nr:EF-P lysine aminoacylase GenX [Patescibacteria group bacterium]
MLSKDDIQIRKRMWQSTESAVHAFFRTRGFEEFRTPLLVNSPGMEPNLNPLEVEVNGERAGLITSPEYSMKKLLGAGFEKIYTITPVFRNNESGPHNIPEFMMLEWYASGSYEDLMNETEDFLQAVLEDDAKWPRYSFAQAGVDEFGDPHISDKRFFVTKYPLQQASLAKISVDGTYAERFEAFEDGMELCNGFAELTDPAEQRRRFEAEQLERQRLGKTVYPIDEELLLALDKIKSPIYGNALGLDRLVMLKYGVGEIEDIQLFNQKF